MILISIGYLIYMDSPAFSAKKWWTESSFSS